MTSMEKQSSDLISRIATLVSRTYREDVKRIEAACETSVQSGQYGVAVHHTQWGHVLRVAVDENVPFGHIHETQEPVRP